MTLLLLAFSAAAFGQTSAPRPAFEIADIHASPASRYPAMRPAFRPGRIELKQATMVDLIAIAWGVEPNQIFGGPGWLELDRFDIVAATPANASQQSVRQMLQSLLSDRFGLAVHPDQKPMPAFVLSAGSGKPRMTQSEPNTPPGCQRQPQGNENAIPAVCRGLTMQMFAQQLRGAAGDYLEAPIVDQTNLEGAWDFTLKWTSRDRLAAAGADAITIFDAIDKQLGLKLEARQLPAPVVVVDRVNRTPTPNSSTVSAGLPPAPPPQFEVAAIKPTDPQFRGVNIQTPPNGVVTIQGLTLSYMIQTIWFLTPDMIVGAPAWLDKNRWDISARVATTPGGAPPTDMDSMMAMVRTLIEERFQMKTHMEERVVPAYTLTAVKPKLVKADPSNRTGCKEGPGADGKDPRLTNPARPRLVTCRNMTMAQFAAQLPVIVNFLNPLNGVIRSTVQDATRLKGAYDFTLNFTPGMFVAPNGGPPQPAGDAPSDPNGALSIFEAINNQLGLKLALEKRAAPVLVIDHIDSKPTEN